MGFKINDVFDFFIELTGMDSECVHSELEKHFLMLNIDKKNLTEEDLRSVMRLYLEELNCSMNEREYVQTTHETPLA